MPNTFKATGILSLAKKTDKNNPYEEITASNPDGWDRRVLRLKLSTDKGTQYLSIRGFKKHDDSNVLKFSERINNERQTISIPFKKRFEPGEMKKVTRNNLLTIDIEDTPAHRHLLRQISHKENPTTDELESAGVTSKAEAEEKLTLSYASRKNYLSKWDFAEKVKDLLEQGKFKNLKVTVRGEIQVSYFDERYFVSLEPSSIVTATEEDESTTTSNVLFYYDKDVIDVAQDKNSITLNGFLQYYDSKLKDNSFVPYSILYQINPQDSEEKKDKRINYISRRFATHGDNVNVMGLLVENVNYAPKRNLTIEDLSEEEQEAIEMGDTTLEKILSSKQQEVRGEFVRANIYKEVLPKYVQRSVETAYRSNDLLGLASDDDDELPF